ncbi:TPA_asm: M [Baccharis alphacytorhabdovirus 1]|nr:TPA_asm: M [Baccharis alphacytorhabdovirus 1]
MSNPLWYRLTFHDSKMEYDSEIPDKETREHKHTCSDLFLSGLKMLFSGEEGLQDVMTNMEKKNIITHIMMLTDSSILGLDIIRCSYVFPSEVYIPSSHILPIGTREETIRDKLVEHDGKMFVANINLRIGIAEMDPKDVPCVMKFNPRKFIGIMDSTSQLSSSSPVKH